MPSNRLRLCLIRQRCGVILLSSAIPPPSDGSKSASREGATSPSLRLPARRLRQSCRCRTCRTTASFTSWAAAIARPTASAKLLGIFSAPLLWDGAACRRSATSSTITSDSTICRPARRERPSRPHERVGVCRDFAHLAVTFCRCLNIPARYVNGHLGDIGVPVVDPMDFSAWIEVFLDGQWHTFDPRNNTRRIGRIVVARSRDEASR